MEEALSSEQQASVSGREDASRRRLMRLTMCEIPRPPPPPSTTPMEAPHSLRARRAKSLRWGDVRARPSGRSPRNRLIWFPTFSRRCLKATMAAGSCSTGVTLVGKTMPGSSGCPARERKSQREAAGREGSLKTDRRGGVARSKVAPKQGISSHLRRRRRRKRRSGKLTLSHGRVEPGGTDRSG